MAILLNRSILPLLPRPEQALRPLKENSEDVIVKTIGGIHNLSFNDKLRWRDDEGKGLMILEEDSDRGEFYPSREWKNKHYSGYVIKYISFINRWPELIIHSHNKNHIEKNPIASVGYIPIAGRGVQQPIMVWMKMGRLHTPDFAVPTVETQKWSVYADEFVRVYENHDYLDRIILKELREEWDNDSYVKTRYRSFQIILRGSRTPEDGDPSTEEWLKQHCKHDFDLLAEEPFEDENDEFNFLTDLAIS